MSPSPSDAPTGTLSVYERRYRVTWADIDANRHMRNTAYADYASHTRFSCLAARGLTLERLGELALGPVVFRESTEYFRELHLDEALVVGFELAAFAPDGSRWRFRHELARQEPDGARTRAALHSLEGAWFDLRTRRLTVPPDELVQAFADVPRTEDFEALPARRRGRRGD